MTKTNSSGDLRPGNPHAADESAHLPALARDDEPVPRRAVAAVLGTLGLLALSGCTAPTASPPLTNERQSKTKRASQALLTGATATDSIGELRAAGIGSDQAVYVQGYYAPGDGGEGHFWCNTADTASADDGGLIIVDILDQRWHRITDGLPFSVKWFGATGNGATDDTVAIQATIDAAQAIGGTVWFPAGAYVTSSTLSCTAAVTLLGAGNHTISGATRICPTDRTFDVIKAAHINYGFVMRGLSVGPPLVASGVDGCGIWLLACQAVDIENVDIVSLYDGIHVDSSGAVYMRRVVIAPAEISVFIPDRYGVKVSGLRWLISSVGNPNSTECHNVSVREQGTNRTVNAFILSEGYNSLTLHDCGAFDCHRRLWMTDLGSGVAPAFLVDESGTSDHNLVGWDIQSADANCIIQLVNCLCTSSFEENFFVRSTCSGSIQFNGCRVARSGGNSIAGQGAGFRLSGAGNYVLLGCVAEKTGGHNVLVTDSSTAAISLVGGAYSEPGDGGGPDKHSFHIAASAGGSFALAGVNQHNAYRGMYDAGSSCLVHGHALFTTNFVTGIDISANLRKSSSPPPYSTPPYSAVWYP